MFNYLSSDQQVLLTGAIMALALFAVKKLPKFRSIVKNTVDALNTVIVTVLYMAGAMFVCFAAIHAGGSSDNLPAHPSKPPFTVYASYQGQNDTDFWRNERSDFDTVVLAITDMVGQFTRRAN
jgi:hypothetical protein